MEEASAVIPASTEKIRRVLLDAAALPEWNEAFVLVEGPAEPTPGQPYSLRIRSGLTGRLEYSRVEPDLIGIIWNVPGFREVGLWTLGPEGQVTHAFEHSGPLAAILRPAYRGIAAVRLQRLATRIETVA